MTAGVGDTRAVQAESTTGPGGIEAIESDEWLVLRKRTYRSTDWVHMVLGIPIGILVLLLIGIGIVKGTLFAYSWWGEGLVYTGLLAWLWFTLTRAFNRRSVTITPEHVTSRDGPLWTPRRGLDVTLAEVEEVLAYVTKHRSPNFIAYRWYHVALAMKDGTRRIVFKKLENKEQAEFVASKIVEFLTRHEAATG